MKRKVIFTSLVLLCMMLIVGIGFAVWDIKNDPANDQASGNIIAYGVVQNGVLQVDIVNSSGGTATESDRKVVFGCPPHELNQLPVGPPTVNNPPWLVFNDIGIEHLEIYVKVTVTYPGKFKITDDILDTADGDRSVKSTLELFGGPDITIATDNSDNDLITGCTASLITESGFKKLYIDSILDGSDEGSVVLKFTYKWPTEFEESPYANLNPYYFFNNHIKGQKLGEYGYTTTEIDRFNDIIGSGTLDSNSTFADFAVQYLTALNNWSQHIAFKITFTEENLS